MALPKLTFFRPTLDSGINIPPGLTVAPPLKNFQITILILFYINLGIAVILNFLSLQNFSKIISLPLHLYRSLFKVCIYLRKPR